MKEYGVDFGGIKRALPLCPIGGGLYIAAFNMLGDNELTAYVAEELYKKIENIDFDAIVTAECKGIALAQALSALLYERRGQRFFVVARKTKKLYMNEPISVTVRSITTDSVQTLWLSRDEVNKLSGKRVLLVDDVISTGATVDAVYKLMAEAKAAVVGELCVFAEGRAKDRPGLICLKELPIFTEFN